VRDTYALVDHLGLNTVDLVGLSLGGMMAIEIVLATHERVRRLVAARNSKLRWLHAPATISIFQCSRVRSASAATTTFPHATSAITTIRARHVGLQPCR
jgi:pimeloyl-ACP methyl ester carboxylesterase